MKLNAKISLKINTCCSDILKMDVKKTDTSVVAEHVVKMYGTLPVKHQDEISLAEFWGSVYSAVLNSTKTSSERLVWRARQGAVKTYFKELSLSEDWMEMLAESFVSRLFVFYASLQGMDPVRRESYLSDSVSQQLSILEGIMRLSNEAFNTLRGKD